MKYTKGSATTILLVIVIVLLAAVLIVSLRNHSSTSESTSTQSAQLNPQSSTYPSQTTNPSQGNIVSLDLSTDFARNYKTNLSATLQKPADFDEHYVVANIGCGSGCMGYAVVDKNTGKVYQGPKDDLDAYAAAYGSIENSGFTQYSLHSNLFKTRDGSGIHTYKFENNQFIKIG